MKRLIISLLLFATVSFATTINVPADQSTIQAGIDAASSGDTVLVAAGTYVESIDFNGKNIVVGSHLLLYPDSLSLISETIIDGDNTLRPVEIDNGEIIGFSILNGYPSESSDYGSSILVYGNCKISYCLINTSSDYGDAVSFYPISGPFDFVELDHITLNNGMVWWGPVGSDTIRVTNSYINESYIEVYGADWDANWGYSFSYCASTNEFTASNDDGTNITVNPLFCDVAGGDFSLGSNSPLIGAGENGANMGAFGVGCGIINQVWHVATTGSDASGDGSEANPYATIQAGIDASSDGDTVLVAAGTYVENISISGVVTLLSSSGAGSTIIDGGQNARVVLLNQGTIHGFTITHGLGGIKSDGGQIVNCFIINNSTETTGEDGGGIYASHYGTVDTTFITNVTISQNYAWSGGGIGMGGETRVAIKNSIIRGNDTGAEDNPLYDEIYGEGWYVTATYSNITSWLDYYDGEGMIDADPLFCNPDSGDYTLAANSPAFGVGCGIINQVWHVSTTGSDVTGDGSADNPFATIQHGIDAAINGDTVLVAAGTYTENVSLNKTIVLMSSEGADSTIIDANNFGTVVTITDGSDATLDGFTLQNGYTIGGSKSGGLIVYNSQSVIKDCIIKNNQSHQGGGLYTYAGSFYNCQIIGNYSPGSGTVVLDYPGYGEYPLFVNCLVAENNG